MKAESILIVFTLTSLVTITIAIMISRHKTHCNLKTFFEYFGIIPVKAVWSKTKNGEAPDIKNRKEFEEANAIVIQRMLYLREEIRCSAEAIKECDKTVSDKFSKTQPLNAPQWVQERENLHFRMTRSKCRYYLAFQAACGCGYEKVLKSCGLSQIEMPV
ncbi:MAG: hypothetical protein WCJ59_01360 [bacterium]